MPGAVGIDLGTTYSAVAVYVNNKAEVIPNLNGNRITPSVVCITDEQRFVGEAAKNVAHKHPKSTIIDAKRLIGCKFDDEKIRKDATKWAFKIAKGKKGGVVIEVDMKEGKKKFAPEEISGMVLSHLKEYAEQFLGEKVTQAVITVPANFSDSQRKSTIDAAQIAGLSVLRIINEPTAAALAYGINNMSQAQNIVVVFDLGGGTFDVSVVACVAQVIEVLSTTGDPHLGGEDFDARVMYYLLERAKELFDIDLSADPRALRLLRQEAEKAKRTLSTSPYADVEVDNLVPGKDFSQKITRTTFEELNADLFQQCITKVEQAVSDAKINKKQINQVLLVGGSSRIPKVQSLLSDCFDGMTLTKAIHGDEAVALGAEMVSAVLANSLSGAAAEGSDNPVLLDVCPLSMGIGLEDGTVSRIIERNTKIPTRETKSGFTTVSDNQPTVEIPIFEGERLMAKDNMQLGTLKLRGIPPATKGVPQFSVTFHIDLDGCLQVEATEKRSGRSEKVNIDCDTNRRSKEDIERMISDAEKYKAKDEEYKESILAACQFRDYLKVVENGLNAYGDAINETTLAALRGTLEEGRAWIETKPDTKQITKKQEELKQQIQPTFDLLYVSGQHQQEEEEMDADPGTGDD